MNMSCILVGHHLKYSTARSKIRLIKAIKDFFSQPSRYFIKFELSISRYIRKIKIKAVRGYSSLFYYLKNSNFIEKLSLNANRSFDTLVFTFNSN